MLHFTMQILPAGKERENAKIGPVNNFWLPFDLPIVAKDIHDYFLSK